MLKVIADTNIWYAIAENKIKIIEQKKKFSKLCVAPLSIIEIVKGSTPTNFELRKKVASVILEHADEVLEELPLHLAKLWGFPIRGYKFDWKQELLQPFTIPSNYSALVSGFSDFKSGVFRALDIAAMSRLHETIWKGWEYAMGNWADKECPGYKNARIEGKIKFLRKDKFAKINDKFQKEELRDLLAKGTIALARHAIARNYRVKNIHITMNKNRIKTALLPFIDANIEYGLSCLVEFAPEPNDYVDLMIFLYLQDNLRLFTLEKKWIKIAKKVCPKNLVML